MGRTVRRHRLQIARFPSVAMLQCCALNYLDVRARAVGNMSELQCFARRCFEVPCPSRAIGACAQRSSHAQLDALAEAAATQVGFDPQKGFTGFVAGLRAPGQLPVLSFKYEYEGRAAVMHATALSPSRAPRTTCLPTATHRGWTSLCHARWDRASRRRRERAYRGWPTTRTSTRASTAREERQPAVSTARANTDCHSSSGRARAARPASTMTGHRWPPSAACMPTPRGTSSSVGGAPRLSGT